ncbi:MAG: manganese efflux pump MntP family protein [Campylobacteraceae bacterium]
MLEIFVLAFALSMDAFAVSLCLGARYSSNIKSTALKAAFYFGLFQGLMPLAGYLIGQKIISYIEKYDHWIAFVILFVLGAKMIYESFKDESCEFTPNALTHKSLFLLAIATSIDALAAGFTISLIEIQPYLGILIIALVTFCVSYIAVIVGSKSGTWLEKKAELLGGVVLILIGFKMLIGHSAF